MDVTRCARILWGATSGMTTVDGALDELTKARLVLARMLTAGHTAGFPEPAVPTARDRTTPGWKACVAAALEAAPPPATGSPPVPVMALLWPQDAGKPQPATGHGLAWPATSVVSDRVGPIRATNEADVWLFLYNAIDAAAALATDGDAAPGIFPRALSAEGAPLPDEAARRRARRVETARPWAILLFVLSILLAIATNLWIYAAADLGRQTALSIQRAAAAEPAQDAPTPAACINGLNAPAGGPAPSQLQARCDTVWATYWAKQKPVVTRDSGWWDRTLDRLWRYTDLGGQLSLMGPMVLSAAAIVALVMAAGLAFQGLFFGALIDERNRLSLSRTQMVAWTIVLLGGYSVLAMFNVALLASHGREQLQAVAVGASTVQSAFSLFPSMDPSLWAVLGISVAVSPYLSRRILPFQTVDEEAGGAARELEVRPTAPQPANMPAGSPRPLDSRASASEASWSDLFQGEWAADADHVDVSRLQHLVITGLLLASYTVLLIEYVQALGGTSVLVAMKTGAPVFTSMPPVDGTFVGLLALSHAAYLGFKALPETKRQGSSANGTKS